jgi:endonuclease/exonuclease/phosphatase family metal-dependent hydrolase
MRLATFNVENLFDRAKAMNLETWAEGRAVLEAFAALNQLLGQTAYTAATRTRMAELMVQLGLERDDRGPFVLLRRNRGKLLRRPRTGGIEITADGRADWAGSLELIEEPVDEEAMRNTARAINEVNADVLAVVEAESRPVLAAFNAELLVALGGRPYRHVMLIDGNDERGIDVGLLTREAFPIGPMHSHVDDRDGRGSPIFSRDCPEYHVRTPSGADLLVLVNHLKSKGYGGTAASNARRKAQAERIRDIYQGRVEAGAEYVAVLGDLNDTPASDPLAPLLGGTDLSDAFVHPAFDDGGYPGTYGLCNAGNKIDYLLLSPGLYERVRAGGVFRKAMWPGSRPVRWQTFAQLTRREEAGSDHAVVWVDLDM